ncbi:sigma-54 dependent transcriptional regulator [uncultured Gilvimarinus sp.]|uniref:sigma-54-dependent transcriptional regulator n=1 Tax=uncultured Gilvimarinus sp. TaxID=1689143 RepID=UPI0030EEE59D
MSNPATSLTQSCAPAIMVVEDDPSLREALVDTLMLADYSVVEADSAESAIGQLKNGAEVAMIVSDVNMGVMSGYDLLKQVKTEYPHIPVLLVTAYASIADSVSAIKEGAVDYLVKPFEPEALLESVARHVGGVVALSDQPVAEAPGSKQLLQLAQRVAQSESTVLIIGESGTGKEVLARYVHDHSPRRDKPFVAINCAAIPENMLEATLFGHEKGAYTGAHTSAPGKFEQANGGTLLLDELSEMDVGLQAKLLRVLQEREVERVGGRKTISLDVRVIATSNRNMRAEVVAGRFREDLYFRLSVLPLEWAPLRDRIEDIVPLATKLLERHARKQKRGRVVLDASAKQALLAYRWPGNVRELDNIMQRALILQAGNYIGAADLGLHNSSSYSDKPSLLDEPDAALAISAAEPATSVVAPPPIDAAAAPGPAELGSDLRRHEFEIIAEALRAERGSRKNTAVRLGISARTLRYKLARFKDEGFALDC